MSRSVEHAHKIMRASALGGLLLLAALAVRPPLPFSKEPAAAGEATTASVEREGEWLHGSQQP